MKYFHQLQADYLFHQVFTSFGLLTSSLVEKASFLPFLIPVVLFVVFLLIARKIFLIRTILKEKPVILEITPPARTEQSSYTTEQLFSLINALGRQQSLRDRLLGRKTRFSLEIVSTQAQGIRYLVRTTIKEAGTLRRSLLSYLPSVNVQVVKDYLPNNEGYFNVIEFKLSKHFALPLRKQKDLEEHDPIAYITGMMTKLSKDELISLQVVVSSTQSKKARKISNLILYNRDVLEYLQGKNPALYPFTVVLSVALSIIFLPFWLLSNMMNNGNTPFLNLPIANSKERKNISSFEQEVIGIIKEKVEQPLFDTSIRLLMVVNSKNEIAERTRGFRSSFASFSGFNNQSIVSIKRPNIDLIRKLQHCMFRKRLSFFGKSLLSVSEISSIYHFPYTAITKTENLVKVHSKELPAPLSLKQEKQLDVTFAKNTYGNVETPIGLSEEEREKHMYIIGATGSGKTTMISSMVKQDIENGKGVAVIDPHGDLAESILSFIPEERKNDLIYVNPDDLRFPIGINLLELTPGLDEDDILREKEFITESVISLFRKVFSETMAGHAHRIEYILRNTIQTALTLENPTLFTIYNLLNNPPFQKSVTNKLTDENLKNFWKYEYGKAGDYQKVKMISPVAARIGRFLFSPSAKRMLEQEKSTINFDEILDKRKILICNLAKGKLGEDTSEVLGIMIISKLQLASLRRAKVAVSKRTPFYLYVDEFQNFATTSFIQMLSEARKYKTYLIMAEQSTSQQKDRNLVNVILANVGTVVSFRSANPEDEKVMLPQFLPYVEKGEIANLPRYHFYIKISAVNPEESFSGQTIPVEVTFNKQEIEKLIELSRAKNAIVYKAPQVVNATSVSSNNPAVSSYGPDVGLL